jgi:hypothetical protein
VGWLRLVVAVAAAAGMLAVRPALGQESSARDRGDEHDMDDMEPGDPGMDPGDGILPPGDWTDEQVAEAHDLVARTEEALPRFADSSQLEALGFFDFGISAPGGYDHWINPGWIDDDHLLDPDFPESLVFRHMPDGGYELQAAMFFLPSGHDMSNIPEDLQWWPGWHMHDDLCVDDGGRFTGIVDVDGTCFSGHPSDMPPMMHIWVVDNECGHRFASIDIGGVECDVMHHGPGHEDPGHEDPGHEDPGHEDPGHEDPGHGGHQPAPGGHDDHDHDGMGSGSGSGSDHDHDMPPEAPPATPVHHHPTFAG